MMMMKSGFDQYFLIPNRKKPFRINMNSLCNEWEGLLFILSGHPALIGRHRPFPVTHRAAERWLHHMEKALESTPDIDADSKIKMMNFFRHTAFFLVAGDELKNQNQRVQCKHGANKPAAT